MNRLKSIVVMLTAAVLAVSCGKEKLPQVEYLEVTPNNIAGEWQLVRWNHEPLDEATYFYVDFVRKDKTFTIYQNFDSIADMPHVVTGEFNLETDLEHGVFIIGMYDYDEGHWAHNYYVRNLTKDSMEWVAVDDDTFVQEFVRTSIPSEIKK